MRIFGHQHAYEAVAVEHSSAGPFTPAGTTILWRCKCGSVCSERIVGKWLLAQVRGEPYLADTSEAEASDTPVKAQG